MWWVMNHHGESTGQYRCWSFVLIQNQNFWRQSQDDISLSRASVLLDTHQNEVWLFITMNIQLRDGIARKWFRWITLINLLETCSIYQTKFSRMILQNMFVSNLLHENRNSTQILLCTNFKDCTECSIYVVKVSSTGGANTNAKETTIMLPRHMSHIDIPLLSTFSAWDVDNKRQYRAMR